MKKTTVIALLLVAVVLGACDKKTDTIKIEVSNVASTSAQLNFTVSNPEKTWYALPVTKSDYEEHYAGASEAAIVSILFDYLLEVEKSYQDAGYNYEVRDFLFVGNQSLTASQLRPETEYIVLAAYIDETGANDGKLFAVEFKTESTVQSDIKFTITEKDGIVTVTPSNNDTYWVTVAPVEKIAAYGYDMSTILPFEVGKYADAGIAQYNLLQGVSQHDLFSSASEWNCAEGEVLMGVACAAVDAVGNILSDVYTAEFTISFTPSAN